MKRVSQIRDEVAQTSDYKLGAMLDRFLATPTDEAKRAVMEAAAEDGTFYDRLDFVLSYNEDTTPSGPRVQAGTYLLHPAIFERLLASSHGRAALLAMMLPSPDPRAIPASSPCGRDCQNALHDTSARLDVLDTLAGSKDEARHEMADDVIETVATYLFG